MNLNQTARQLFAVALRSLDIAAAMRHLVTATPAGLVVDGKHYAASDFRRIVIVSIGKAAVPMAEALLSQIQPALTPALTEAQTIEGIVVGSSLPEVRDERMHFFQGGHPLPDSNSQLAASAILELLATCDRSCLVFFLISGGASAMVEQPLDAAHTLQDARDLHRALVHSGLPITQMNALRKHFSRVKGGRLAVAANGATQCTLLISDVPSDSLHVVGSGPSLPDPSTVGDCVHLLESSAASLDFSRSLLDFFTSPLLPETPKPDHPAFLLSQHAALLSSDDLCALAAQTATDMGFYVAVDNTCDDWEYREAANYLLHRLEELRRDHASDHRRVCLLSAGELSVKITGTPGSGGRNQQFVLECARRLAEINFPATVLSGGSDGVDGNSGAAGALCDETTVARAEARGIDVAGALRRFDSAPVFSALGDAIITTPTGNNVRDLRILLSTA